MMMGGELVMGVLGGRQSPFEQDLAGPGRGNLCLVLVVARSRGISPWCPAVSGGDSG